MDDATISAVVSEITPLIVGRSPGKIFQLNQQSLAIDFALRSHGFLFISVEPTRPRVYLIKRRVRDLEKESVPLGQFALTLRKEVAATQVLGITKLPNDRIVKIEFQSIDIEQSRRRTLVAQLTGRSANLFLLDDNDVVLAHVREGGQTVGESYQAPSPPQKAKTTITNASRSPAVSKHASISEVLDDLFQKEVAEQTAQSQLAAARVELRREVSRRKRLLKQLERDLATHADAEHHKRIGDLLLANVGTARRNKNHVTLIDYFATDAPKIEIEVDEKLTLPEEATRRFEIYARSKRARKQIALRIEQVKQELIEWETRLEQFEAAPDKTTPTPVTPASRRSAPSRKEKAERIPGVRRYVSTDGYEILVGRAARDNDNLTFKIAKPHDLWLHAADYPGSHVVVRNSTRKDVPHRTLVEAAQLAAHFSQANKDPKVDVHYTQRKFLSKPKGAAAGLVRMSRFKSILVAPKESSRRLL